LCASQQLGRILLNLNEFFMGASGHECLARRKCIFFCKIVHTLTLHTTEHYISTYLEKGLSFQLYNYYLIT